MKTWIVLALVVLSGLIPGPASPFGYGNESFVIDLKKDLQGLNLGVSTHQTGRTAIVEIQNRTTQKIHCRARFHNGPEIPRRRQSSIEGSESIILAYTAKRPVIRMQILLECTPEGEDR